MEDGACRGLIALEMVTGDLHLLRAKAVIVASGGLGRLYEPSAHALICTGDGYSLAYRAGAPLMDMAMVQYHPTTLAGSGFLMTEAARGEGAYLLNSVGERFMKKYAPNKMELAARDVTSRAEATEIAEGRGIDGNVLLDLRHLGRDVILKKLPQIHEMALDYLDIDMIKDRSRAARNALPDGRNQDERRRRHRHRGLTPPAKSRASACTAEIASARTRCSTDRLRPRSGRASAVREETPQSDGGEDSAAPEQARLTKTCSTGRTPARPAPSAPRARDDDGRESRTLPQRRRPERGPAPSACTSFRKRYENVAVGDKGRVFNQALTFVLELGFMLDCGKTIIRDAMRPQKAAARTRVPNTPA